MRSLQLRLATGTCSCSSPSALVPRPRMGSSRVAPLIPLQKQQPQIARSTAPTTPPSLDLHPHLEVAMQDIKVEEIMQPHPVCFKQDQTVKDAARLMIEKDISGGPVLDSSGALCGFLSEDDLIWKGAGQPMDHFLVPPVFIGAFDLFFFLKDNAAVETELRKVLAKQVKDAMTKQVVSVSTDVSMSEASRVLLEHKINCMPVVDASKQVVGVLTRHDVLRALIASHNPLLE